MGGAAVRGEPVALVMLLMPRRPLEAANCPLRIGDVVPGDLPASRLLHGYLDALCPVLPALPGVAALAARNALFELAWGALQPEEAAGPRALLLARRAAVERYLDTRLGHAGLTREEVAAAHNISLRTLARLFAETGETFSGVVRAKRVARVREELLTSDVSVAALAHRWGFFDMSHLNRRFRAVHRMSPKEYRARHRDA
ncbi:hypothetical protein Asp14428_55300 [Actinoplanes sp. NBRC 14428]|nr:hypothetical protein Asp14428_55300 [Actinoplanes sp. NBRC 14428]